MPTPFTLAIEPILVRSTFFPLGLGVSVGDLEVSGSILPAYTGSEIVQPYGAQFYPGTILQLSASQNKYSFDYYEVWPPNQVLYNKHSFVTRWHFTASFDPMTTVMINDTGSIIGTSFKSRTGIVARYR